MGNCTVLAERPSTYRDTEITTLIPDGQIIGKHNTSGPLYKFYFSITLHFAEKKKHVEAIKIYSNISAPGEEASTAVVLHE